MTYFRNVSRSLAVAVLIGAPVYPALADETLSTVPAAVGELKCKNVSDRWQICGDAGRTKLVLGVGVRFMEVARSGILSVGATHASCASALADEAVPSAVRERAAATCGEVFARAIAAAPVSAPVLLDQEGLQLPYDLLPGDHQRVVDRAVTDLRAFAPEVEIGCQLGPGISISCWGGGKMCAAWVDEDGPGAQCFTCDIADCD